MELVAVERGRDRESCRRSWGMDIKVAREWRVGGRAAGMPTSLKCAVQEHMFLFPSFLHFSFFPTNLEASDEHEKQWRGLRTKNLFCRLRAVALASKDYLTVVLTPALSLSSVYKWNAIAAPATLDTTVPKLRKPSRGRSGHQTRNTNHQLAQPQHFDT